jgi:ParB family chromosome partitioning protein
LRLLRLPDPIKAFLTDGRLSLGHARALLVLDDPQFQATLAGRIVAEGLSVRQVEHLVKVGAGPRRPGGRKAAPAVGRRADPHVATLATELQQRLGTRVTIRHGRKRGTIQIEYYSLDDLERLIGLLRRRG